MHRILIVDDDGILLRRLEKAFESHAGTATVATAANGREAIDLLAKQAVSLLITDIQMPEVDGLELLAHVSRHHPVVRCFVMTAHDSEALQKELPKDLFRVFKKPLDPAVVAEAAAALLRRQLPRGTVSGISVGSFLRMIVLEKKTCLLEVRPKGREKGLLYFEKGVLFDATYKGLRGEAAAGAILDTGSATFSFRHFPDRPIARRVHADVQALIDAARARREELADVDWDEIVSGDAAGNPARRSDA